MNTRVGLSFRPKACLRCGGDAYLSRGDDIDWVCLQCGRVVPDVQAVVSVPSPISKETEGAAVALAEKAA